MAPKKPRPTPKMLRMCEQMFFAVQAERDRRDDEMSPAERCVDAVHVDAVAVGTRELYLRFRRQQRVNLREEQSSMIDCALFESLRQRYFPLIMIKCE